MNERHDVEWIPPEPLDTGQARINNYHRPERLLRSEEPEPPSDNTIGDIVDPAGDGEAADEEPGQIQSDDSGEPGGPAPPTNDAA